MAEPPCLSATARGPRAAGPCPLGLRALERDLRQPARLPEPAEPDRLRDPHLHRRVLARQTCRDERPEPTPILTPRYPRPPRRPQLTPQGPIRTPPTRHRNRPPSSCCDDHLRPGSRWRTAGRRACRTGKPCPCER